MNISLKNEFKVLFIIGLIILIISMFLDWYYIQVYDSRGKLIAFWSYNPFTEWTTVSSGGSGYKKISHPKDLLIPLVINAMFIPVVVVCGYCVLFKDIEKKIELEKLQRYAYINLFLVLINCYYIFAFPIFYLFPNHLYFPFITIKDADLNVVYHYSIGPGYFLQVISFIMIFPYAIFYYQTIEKFKTKQHSIKKVIDRYIQTVQESMDLDKLITEEANIIKKSRKKAIS